MRSPSGTKECPAAEPHGWPRPVPGNGVVTAVSSNNQATRNPLAGVPSRLWLVTTEPRDPQGFPSGRA
jgi:hypothetical protein